MFSDHARHYNSEPPNNTQIALHLYSINPGIIGGKFGNSNVVAKLPQFGAKSLIHQSVTESHLL